MKKSNFAALTLIAALGISPAVVNATPTKPAPKKMEKTETKSTEKTESKSVQKTEAKSAPKPAPRQESAAAAEQARLQKEAKISMAEAKKIALKQVKNGTIQSSQLEREHGKVVYSFDIRQASKPGLTEINVDATNGKIVAMAHENAKKEAMERKHVSMKKSH